MRPQGLDALELAVAYHALEDGLHCRELVLLSDVLRQPSRLEVRLHINSKPYRLSLLLDHSLAMTSFIWAGTFMNACTKI